MRQARLIAAAPDLLVALRACLELLQAVQADDPEDWNAPPYVEIQDAEAAIARAEGKP